jgi:hypothetical protein
MATLKFSVKLHKDGTGSVIDILTGHPSYASGVILRHLPEGVRATFANSRTSLTCAVGLS